MILEIKIPSPGESISEVIIANWLVADGEVVWKDQEIGEVESDKATLPLIAEEGGKVSLKAAAGDTVKVGEVVALIDSSFAPAEAAAPVSSETKTIKPEEKKADLETPTKPAAASSSGMNAHSKVKTSPVAQKMMEAEGVDLEAILSGLKRLGKKEVQAALNAPQGNDSGSSLVTGTFSREKEANKMTPLRKKLSERLVSVKNETAMLTTFNEIDMSAVMALRKQYQQAFTEKHGVKLGFMSFFTKAASLALQLHPQVNSMIDGDSIVSHHYSDIGIAVQTPKGLMVPVIRNTESLGLGGIELALAELAAKARAGRISLDDLSGGTFTITNGGVFGSLLSTPIINPPQAGILGMHNIVERPVAVNGQVVIRPMMYVALSYDHRIIDGKDSVGFLVKIKEFIENPVSMLFPGKTAESVLMGL